MDSSFLIDYNGHMTESRYLQVFGDATVPYSIYLGLDQNYLNSDIPSLP